MTVAEYIAKFLAAQGVRHVFTLSGGMICPMLDALALRGGLANDPTGTSPIIIPMRHEQAVGFAAEGEARMTGIPGVAMATSGPGATNLLTAIASCYFDSTPAVFITGQVPTHEQRRGAERQRGFQETDIVKIAEPVTKWAGQLDKANDPDGGLSMLHHAFTEAMSGRPGPVLIDIPYDVQRSEVEEWWPAPMPAWPLRFSNKIDSAPLLAALRASKRPLALVGGGVRASQAVPPVRRLLSYLWIPTIHSLMGKDVLGAGHPLDVGMIGTYGNRGANKALAECDFLLVLGSRLDLRQLGSDAGAVLHGKRVFWVDVDHAEMEKHAIDSVTRVVVDLHDFCDAIAPEGSPVAGRTVRYSSIGAKPAWNEQIAAWRVAWPPASEVTIPEGAIHPLMLLDELGSRLLDAGVAAVVTDVGSHQMWAAQAMGVSSPIRFLTSGGHGAMGFGLPAAIGACLAAKGAPVVLVTGDASLLVNVQELATVAELNLPIKIVVLDNGGHGMVREFQDRYFEGRHTATGQTIRRRHHVRGLTAIADAFGLIASILLYDEDANGYGAVIDAWLNRSSGPALLHVLIDPATPVAPRMVYGEGPGTMSPPR